MILVAIGQFIIMIPYGLALAAVSMIGHQLGANKPREAVRNCKFIALTTSVICFFFILVLYGAKNALISLFTDNEEVARLAESAFLVFILAFMFDWKQCCASGIIKGAGYQSYASVCSFGCLMGIAMPMSYLLTFKLDFGISGLWTGYGLSTFTLTALYYTILACIDWEKTAEWAANNEDFSVSEESDQNDGSQLALKKFGIEEPTPLNRTLTSTSNELVELDSSNLE